MLAIDGAKGPALSYHGPARSSSMHPLPHGKTARRLYRSPLLSSRTTPDDQDRYQSGGGDAIKSLFDRRNCSRERSKICLRQMPDEFFVWKQIGISCQLQKRDVGVDSTTNTRRGTPSRLTASTNSGETRRPFKRMKFLQLHSLPSGRLPRLACGRVNACH